MRIDLILDRFSKRRRQVLAAGLALISLLALWHVAVSPIIGWFLDHHGEVAQLRGRLAVSERFAAQAPALQAKLDALGNHALLRQSVFATADDAGAPARLQAEVRQALTVPGAQIVSSQIVPETSEAGFRRLAVKVTLRGPLGALQKALHGLEASKRPLFVQSLTMTAANAAPRPGPQPMAAPDLTMTVEVAAFAPAPPEQQLGRREGAEAAP